MVSCIHCPYVSRIPIRGKGHTPCLELPQNVNLQEVGQGICCIQPVVSSGGPMILGVKTSLVGMYVFGTSQ